MLKAGERVFIVSAGANPTFPSGSAADGVRNMPPGIVCQAFFAWR